MRFLERASGKKIPVGKLSFKQQQRVVILADALARLIPQEGVDYDVDVILDGDSRRVSMEIIPLTDKGALWRDYVKKMIRVYPPSADYKGFAIGDEGEVGNEKDVS